MSWQFLNGLAAGRPVAVERADALIVSAPHWFKRADFRTWRQGGVACWGPELHDGDSYADVFMTFDRDEHINRALGYEADFWEGSDTEGLPEDIYWEIGRRLAEARFSHGLIWIKPV